MSKKLYRRKKVVFLWLGTYRVGFIQSIYKNKSSNKKVYYTYDIRGEDNKLYENIPILDNTHIGINLSLTNKIEGGENE